MQPEDAPWLDKHTVRLSAQHSTRRHMEPSLRRGKACKGQLPLGGQWEAIQVGHGQGMFQHYPVQGVLLAGGLKQKLRSARAATSV